jgi:hypothetical protein
MVHPGTPSAQEYFRNQITGGMNVSFAYRIPMLVHEAYVKDWTDLNVAFSYTQKSFCSDVEKAMKDLVAMQNRMGNIPKFNPEWQEERYILFLFNG